MRWVSIGVYFFCILIVISFYTMVDYTDAPAIITNIQNNITQNATIGKPKFLKMKEDSFVFSNTLATTSLSEKGNTPQKYMFMF